MTPEQQRLVDVALLMAQELQEIVDYACDDADDSNAMEATQALLRDWEDAYQASGLGWINHFAAEKSADDSVLKDR